MKAIVDSAAATTYSSSSKAPPRFGGAIADAESDLARAVAASQIAKYPKGFRAKDVRSIWKPKKGGRPRVATFDPKIVGPLAVRIMASPRAAYAAPKGGGKLDYSLCRRAVIEDILAKANLRLNIKTNRSIDAIFGAALRSAKWQLDGARRAWRGETPDAPIVGIDLSDILPGGLEQRAQWSSNLKDWTKKGPPSHPKTRPA